MIQHKIKIKEALAIARGAPLASVITLLQRVRQRIPLDYQWLKNGWSFYPSVIVFYATVRCNLSCPMCVDEKLKKRTDELSFVEIKKIIDQIAFFRPLFYITGGECLLRKDIGEIIRYAKKKGLICSLTTNGTLLTGAKAKQLVESGLDRISVSIDGPKGIHDQIRGKGSFKKTIRGVHLLQQLKKGKKQVLPSVKMAAVVTGLNISRLEEIIKIAETLEIPEVVLNQLDYKSLKVAQAHRQYFQKKFGVSCFPQGLIYYQKASAIERKMLSFDLFELVKKFKEVEKIAAQKGMAVYHNPAVKWQDAKRYYSSQFLLQSYCLNSWLAVKILPNADVIPCFNLPMGNLREEKFVSIWNNSKYRLFRKTLKEEKHFPGCLHCCALEV